MSMPGVTKGYLDTKGLRITYKKRPEKNKWLGPFMLLFGLSAVAFRYFWENHPNVRDYQLNHWVRNMAVAAEIARLYFMRQKPMLSFNLDNNNNNVKNSFNVQGSSTLAFQTDAIGNDITVITGDSIASMLAKQGYAHAKDRSFQMTFLRTMAIGNLSANLGSQFAKSDIFIRPFDLRTVAVADCLALTSAEMGYATAYATGVNNYLRESELPPLEARVSGWINDDFWRKEWTCEDSFLVLRLAALRWAHGWESSLIDSFLTTASSDDMTTEKSLASLISDMVVEKDEGEDLMSAENHTNANVDEGEIFKFVPSIGSIALAVSSERRADGEKGSYLYNELFGGTMQQRGVEDAWYVNRLESSDEGVSVSGYSIPGVPFVLIGHNKHAAWGITMASEPANWIAMERFQLAESTTTTSVFNCGAHENDESLCTTVGAGRSAIKTEVFLKADGEKKASSSSSSMAADRAGAIEKVVHYAISEGISGSGSGVFIPLSADPRSLRMLHRSRRVAVDPVPSVVGLEEEQGQDTCSDDSKSSSTLLPVLYSSALSSKINLNFLYQSNIASAMPDFRAAVRSADALFLNWIYADVEGNIASIRSGKSSKSDSSSSSSSIGASDASSLDVVNPKSGIIISGDIVVKNNLLMDSNFPSSKVDKLLNQEEKLSRSDILNLVQDPRSLFSARLAEVLSGLNLTDVASSSSSRRDRKGGNLPAYLAACQAAVKGYSGFADADTPAQVIVETFKNKLIDNLVELSGLSKHLDILSGYELFPFTSHTAHRWFYPSTWLLRLIASRSDDDNAAAAADLVNRAFISSCQLVHSELGTSSSGWAWGRAHADAMKASVLASHFYQEVYSPGPIVLTGTGDSFRRSDTTYSSVRGSSPQLRMFVDMQTKTVGGKGGDDGGGGGASKADNRSSSSNSSHVFDTRFGGINSFRLDSFSNYLKVGKLKVMS